MHITWKYLDKRAATIEALRDYHSMQFIIENTEDAIKERYERMMSISSPAYDGMPHVHDPQSGETRLANSLYQIDVLKSATVKPGNTWTGLSRHGKPYRMMSAFALRSSTGLKSTSPAPMRSRPSARGFTSNAPAPTTKEPCHQPPEGESLRQRLNE